MHKISWTKVCMPVEYGGLGVRDTESSNLSLLAKMAWRIHANPDSEVTKLLKAKYHSEVDFWTCTSKTNSSRSWRSILKGRDAIKSCIRWNIGDGKDIDLWNDPWVSNLPLSVIANVSNQNVPSMLVKDIIDPQTKTWNLDSIDMFISEQVAADIKAKPIGVTSSSRDQVVWSQSKSGDVTVKEAYNFILSNKLGNQLPNLDWRFMWSLACPQKIKFFLWLFCHNRLNLNEPLYRKHIVPHPGCSLCDRDFETSYHLFFNCAAVKPIWRKIERWFGFQPKVDFTSPTMLKNLCKATGQIGGVEWKYILPHVLWSIWEARNDWVFNKHKFQPYKVLATALRSAREFLGAIGRLKKQEVQSIDITVPWIHPKQGYCKINCDGASNQCGDAGIGGVIRDDSGLFKACLAKHVFKNNSNVAEMWAVRDGLLLARDMGIRKLEMVSDSTYAVMLCNQETEVPWFLRGLISDIEILKMDFEDIVIGQRYREANSVADYLEKSGASREMKGVWLGHPPNEVAGLLSADFIGRAITRTVRVIS